LFFIKTLSPGVLFAGGYCLNVYGFDFLIDVFICLLMN